VSAPVPDSSRLHCFEVRHCTYSWFSLLVSLSLFIIYLPHVNIFIFSPLCSWLIPILFCIMCCRAFQWALPVIYFLFHIQSTLILAFMFFECVCLNWPLLRSHLLVRTPSPLNWVPPYWSRAHVMWCLNLIYDFIPSWLDDRFSLCVFVFVHSMSSMSSNLHNFMCTCVYVSVPTYVPGFFFSWLYGSLCVYVCRVLEKEFMCGPSVYVREYVPLS